MSTAHIPLQALCVVLASVLADTGQSAALAPPWITVAGTNLDTKGRCGCSGACHDIPGFHFAGSPTTVAACEATCTGAGSNCSMWFYSSHSSHCWWKLGTDWESVATTGITAGCDPTRVPNCGKAPSPPPPPPPPPPLPPAVPCTGNSSALPAAECGAWQDLYHATNGNSWSFGRTALTDPCSVLYSDGGVECTGGHVVSVMLAANNLSGYLPQSISAFSSLAKLQIPYNFVTGSIPITVARLSQLTTFDVTCNSMSGIVPPLPFQQYSGFCGLSDHHCTAPYPTNNWKCPLPPNAATDCPAALCSR
eukprot:m.136858 g.136858  ORF g.136858 m.136858 type:complete len:307 (+) comp13966_c0_seq2:2714-3634(+)